MNHSSLSLNKTDVAEMERRSDRQIVLSSGRASAIAHVVLVLLAGIGGSLIKDNPPLVFSVVALMSAVSYERYHQSRLLLTVAPEKLLATRRAFERALVLTAGLWGAYASYILHNYEASWTGMLALVNLLGITAGATMTLTPRLKIFQRYVSLVLGPPALVLLLLGTFQGTVLATLTAFYLLFILITARAQNRNYREGLLSAALLGKRTEQVEEARRVEAELLAQETRQRKLLAEQNVALIQVTREAQAASEAKSAFLATISHELRTPMNAIFILSTLLGEAGLDAQQREWLATIGSSSEQLLSIISDVLDYSSMESGKVEPKIGEVGLPGLIEEVVRQNQAQADAKGLRLVYEFDAGIPDRLLTDGLRLRQIASHLLNNAVKFTVAGQVGLKVSCPNHTHLQMLIYDTGPGVPSDRLDALFVSFSQIDASLTREFGGLGLGLALAERLCHLLGGTIWVESNGAVSGHPPDDWQKPMSTPGTGCRFWFRIPVGIASPAVLPATVKEHTPKTVTAPVTPEQEIGRALTLLVVEDNTTNQKVLKQLLQTLGYAVDIVENGRLAVETIESHDYPIVLMDIQMPEMDGLEATRRIRDMKQSGLSPWIIAVTANALPSDRENCMQAGMNDYLSKPVRKAELLAALGRAPK